jgi:DNA-binding MarR family transcriptional regulator
MKDIFFQERGKQILLSLAEMNKRHISQVASDIKGTYAHTFNLLKEMEGTKIVKSVKKGRTRYVSLTEKGKKLAGLLQNFIATLKSRRAGSTNKKTPTDKKLQKYAASLNSILKKIKSRKLSSKQAAKYARLAGRFRTLNSRLRPKDRTGKRLKEKVILLIREIELVLKAHKV